MDFAIARSAYISLERTTMAFLAFYVALSLSLSLFSSLADALSVVQKSLILYYVYAILLNTFSINVTNFWIGTIFRRSSANGILGIYRSRLVPRSTLLLNSDALNYCLRSRLAL